MDIIELFLYNTFQWSVYTFTFCAAVDSSSQVYISKSIHYNYKKKMEWAVKWNLYMKNYLDKKKGAGVRVSASIW